MASILVNPVRVALVLATPLFFAALSLQALFFKELFQRLQLVKGRLSLVLGERTLPYRELLGRIRRVL